MALGGALAPSQHISSRPSVGVPNSNSRQIRQVGIVSFAGFNQLGRGCAGSALGRKVRLESRVVRAMAESGEQQVRTAGPRVEEKLGVRIERGPSESRLKELGIRSWPKWGCPASKFPWTYDGKETCYLLQGKVKVYPEGSSDFVEFGAGDLVVFPKGMSCTWEVSEAVDKHYQFEY